MLGTQARSNLDGHTRIRELAYKLHQSDPSRTAEENWLLAREHLSTEKLRVSRGFRYFLISYLGLSVFIFAARRFQDLAISGLLMHGTERYANHLLVTCGILVLSLFVRLYTSNPLLVRGLLWPFKDVQARLRSSNIPEWVKVIAVPILGIFLTAGTTWYINSIKYRQEEKAKELAALRESFSKHFESLSKLIAETGPWEKWSEPQRLLVGTNSLNLLASMAGHPSLQGSFFRSAIIIYPYFACSVRDITNAISSTSQSCILPQNIDVRGINLDSFCLTPDCRAPLMIFGGADLSNASLRFSYFKEADLASTDFRGANLSSSFFDKVLLTHANLAGANLARAVFVNSDLSRVRGLDRAVLDGTVFDFYTAFPLDFDVCRSLRQGRITIRIRMPSLVADSGRDHIFRSAKIRRFVDKYGCDPFAR